MDGWTTALIVVSVILVLTLFLFFLVNRTESRARTAASVARRRKGGKNYAIDSSYKAPVDLTPGDVDGDAPTYDDIMGIRDEYKT